MPTTNVSTIDQLRTACEPDGTADDWNIVNITTDLDFNSLLFGDGVTNQIPMGNYVKIEGNGHVFNAIQSQSNFSASIFSGSHTKTQEFNNLIFANCVLRNTWLAHGINTVRFNNCQFMGTFKIINGGNYRNCLLNVIETVGGAFSNSGTWVNCYLDINNWTTMRGTVIGNAYTQCYFTGKNNATAGNTIILSGGSNNICFNMEINHGENVLQFAMNGNDVKSIYNTEKITGTGNVDIFNPTTFIGVTDAQMRDANYLESIGFDIILT